MASLSLSNASDGSLGDKIPMQVWGPLSTTAGTSDEIPLTQIDLDETVDETKYPSSWKLAVITIALCLAVFLVALVSRLSQYPSCS